MFSGQFCSNPVFSTENPGANSGHATSGGTSETWHDTNQSSGFHLTSAVSAAAAAMALSPSHVGYMNQEIYHQNQVSILYAQYENSENFLLFRFYVKSMLGH